VDIVERAQKVGTLGLRCSYVSPSGSAPYSGVR
jgi:hypothetical protein